MSPELPDVPGTPIGIDGEIEFVNDDGTPLCGTRIYLQLKSGDSYTHESSKTGKTAFYAKKMSSLDYWCNHKPGCVFLTIANSDWRIRWMNITQYLNQRTDKDSRRIVFVGEEVTPEAILRQRDRCLNQKEHGCTCNACSMLLRGHGRV